MEENKNDVKEDFKDEGVPVEPVLDNDGNEIGGEGQMTANENIIVQAIPLNHLHQESYSASGVP